VSPIACSLAALLVLEASSAGPPECPLTDNRCKAERFVQRAATAASSAVRAKYLEAAHGSFLALYDASGDVGDLCAARRAFDQTLAALGTEVAPQRLAPLQAALEEREQARRPRCAAGPRKAPKPPALARATPPTAASPLAASRAQAQPSPEHSDALMPVSTAPRALAAASMPTMRAAPKSAVTGDAPGPAATREAPPPAATREALWPTAPAREGSASADRRLVIAGSVMLGLGLSLVGVAGYAGSQRMEARRASLELLAEAQGHASAEQTARDLALRDRFQNMGHLALGTSLAGGAAIVVGTVLAVVGGRRLARLARRMALGPLPGGLALHGRF